MSAKISNLLKKAAKATPAPKGKWLQFVPVVKELKTKGFSTWTAVEWLVSDGQITKDDQRTAYHSIVQRLQREAKEAKQAK